MNTPLTTAEIVERLRKGIQQRQKHILDGDGNAIGLAGYTFDVDGTDTLMSEAASALLALEGERDAAREQWHTNSVALVSMQQNRDTLQRHFNECTVRAETAEAELAKVREERDAFFDKLRQLLCINSVLTALKADAPLWLEHAEKLIDDHNAALSEKTV